MDAIIAAPADLGPALRAEWTKLWTVPGPAGLLLAAVVLTGVVVAGRVLLPGGAFTGTDGPALRAAAGSVLYLALIGLLSLGVATAVRDAAAAAGVVEMTGAPDRHRRLQRLTPTSTASPGPVGRSRRARRLGRRRPGGRRAAAAVARRLRGWWTASWLGSSVSRFGSWP